SAPARSREGFSTGCGRLQPHEHLADIVTREEPNEGLWRVFNASNNCLLPLDFPGTNPHAHIIIELCLPIEMVRDDKTPQGETLPYSQTQIPRSGRRCSFIVVRDHAAQHQPPKTVHMVRRGFVAGPTTVVDV